MKALQKNITNIRKIYVSLILLLSLLLLSACSLFESHSDHDMADRNIQHLVQCLDAKDKEGLRALFSANKADEAAFFEENLDELLDYYSGEFVSLSAGGLLSEAEKHAGKV